MFLKMVGTLLCIILLCSASLAQTLEAQSPPNFWQEFDITFWQTFPFATLIGYFADQQISTLVSSGSAPNWQIVLPISIAVSAANAYFQAGKVVNNSIK